MNQNKSLYIILIVISTFIIYGCSEEEQEQYKFVVGERYESELEHVEKVVLVNGSNGNKQEITNKTEIDNIVNLLLNVECVLMENQDDYTGWSYSMKLYEDKEDEGWFSFTFAASPIGYYNRTFDEGKNDNRNFELLNTEDLKELIASYFQ